MNTESKHFASFAQIKSVLNQQRIDVDVWNAKSEDGLRPAAVLFGLFERDNQLHVLLTQRTEQLKHHSGQISFPGGGFEPQDINIRQAAIRETYEEIGIGEDQINVLGYLDDAFSISNYRVTPFVAELTGQLDYTIDPQEVEAAFSVPLDFFMNKDNQQVSYYTNGTKRYKYYIYQYENYTIWGLTAKIIVQLIDRIKQ